MEQVYGDDLKAALHYEATNFASSYLENKGDGRLVLSALPNEAQLAPVMGTISGDFNRDGNLDVLLAGNLFVAEVETPRADGGTGLVMLGDGNGNFEPLSMQQSGIIARNDVRDIALIKTGPNEAPLVLVANNNAGVQLFRHVAPTQ